MRQSGVRRVGLGQYLGGLLVAADFRERFAVGREEFGIFRASDGRLLQHGDGLGLLVQCPQPARILECRDRVGRIGLEARPPASHVLAPGVRRCLLRRRERPGDVRRSALEASSSRESDKADDGKHSPRC